jgi:dipeptidyl aminopeptidase/acylaminoacyl peptidase
MCTALGLGCADGGALLETLTRCECDREAATARHEAFPRSIIGDAHIFPSRNSANGWLSFLSSRQGADGSQLWLFNRLGGEPARVSDVPGGIDDYAWSPDSRRLVFVVSDPDTDDAKGKTKKPIVINRYHFKSDPGGYLLRSHNHLALFDLETRRTEPLTSGTNDETDPVWSPDGSRIAYLTGVGLPDHSYRMWKLAVVPSAGGSAQVLTASLDRQVIQPAWSADGASIYMLEEDDRSQYVAKVSASGGAVERVAGDKHMITSLDIGRDDAATLLMASDSAPPEVYALEGATLRRLTHQNDEWLRDVQLGITEEFSSRSTDGWEVHGIMVKPASYVAGRKYPTLLRIHGGPSCCQDSHAFNIERELFAANGYVVLAPNYRGSRGRGAAHQRAISSGGKELEVLDLLGAVDHAVRIGVADPDHLGIGGWSNGAILTNRVIAVDHRFKSAIAGAGSANALAMYGTDQYTPATGTGPWKNPDEWIKRSYAVFHANQITTPTLFLGGDKDFNVPIAGSEQMYVALRSLGVPAELIIYPDQHHNISTPSYKKDRLDRYVAWYDKYVKPTAAVEADR